MVNLTYKNMQDAADELAYLLNNTELAAELDALDDNAADYYVKFKEACNKYAEQYRVQTKAT